MLTFNLNNPSRQRAERQLAARCRPTVLLPVIDPLRAEESVAALF